MKRLLAGLLLLPLVAFGAAPTATLSWTPAGSRADGTQVGPSFFAVYSGTSGAEVLLKTGIAVPNLLVTGVAGTTICYYVTQIETSTSAESMPSPEVCKSFAVSAPNSPTGVTIK
jgi:hypothetical protein